MTSWLTRAAFSGIVLAGAASCTAGQIVHDGDGTAVPNAFVEFREASSTARYRVRTDATGQFVFDPKLAASSGNKVSVVIPEGTYSVWVGHAGCTEAWEDVRWDHFTTTTFHHTFDTTCRGSDDKDEPCEYYQVRLSSKDVASFFPNPPPAEPTHDSHTGSRVLTLYKDVLGASAPLPCD